MEFAITFGDIYTIKCDVPIASAIGGFLHNVGQSGVCIYMYASHTHMLKRAATHRNQDTVDGSHDLLCEIYADHTKQFDELQSNPGFLKVVAVNSAEISSHRYADEVTHPLLRNLHTPRQANLAYAQHNVGVYHHAD